jgi:hypothetical protein
MDKKSPGHTIPEERGRIYFQIQNESSPASDLSSG